MRIANIIHVVKITNNIISILKESVGFEPTDGLHKATNTLAVCRLKPLSQLSDYYKIPSCHCLMATIIIIGQAIIVMAQPMKSSLLRDFNPPVAMYIVKPIIRYINTSVVIKIYLLLSP